MLGSDQSCKLRLRPFRPTPRHGLILFAEPRIVVGIREGIRPLIGRGEVGLGIDIWRGDHAVESIAEVGGEGVIRLVTKSI